MVKEIRDAYPDEKEMPSNLRKFVDKHDPNSGKQLTAAMNKTTKRHPGHASRTAEADCSGCSGAAGNATDIPETIEEDDKA